MNHSAMLSPGCCRATIHTWRRSGAASPAWQHMAVSSLSHLLTCLAALQRHRHIQCKRKVYRHVCCTVSRQLSSNFLSQVLCLHLSSAHLSNTTILQTARTYVQHVNIAPIKAGTHHLQPHLHQALGHVYLCLMLPTASNLNWLLGCNTEVPIRTIISPAEACLRLELCGGNQRLMPWQRVRREVRIPCRILHARLASSQLHVQSLTGMAIYVCSQNMPGRKLHGENLL